MDVVKILPKLVAISVFFGVFLGSFAWAALVSLGLRLGPVGPIAVFGVITLGYGLYDAARSR